MKKPAKKRKAPAMAKKQPAKTDHKAINAKAYFDMEPYVCDLARQARLAMVVSDEEDLFLHVVEQFHDMAQRLQELYYAKEFPRI
jgi:hypothetical protein